MCKTCWHIQHVNSNCLLSDLSLRTDDRVCFRKDFFTSHVFECKYSCSSVKHTQVESTSKSSECPKSGEFPSWVNAIPMKRKALLAHSFEKVKSESHLWNWPTGARILGHGECSVLFVVVFPLIAVRDHLVLGQYEVKLVSAAWTYWSGFAFGHLRARLCQLDFCRCQIYQCRSKEVVVILGTSKPQDEIFVIKSLPANCRIVCSGCWTRVQQLKLISKISVTE